MVFFGFFWHWFWPEFKIGNWFLLGFFVFFWVFLVFFGFFWHRPWPTFEIGNWFLGLFWFFLVFFGFFLVFFGIFWFFLVFEFRVRIHSQKKTKKNQKKPKKPKKKPKKPKKNQKKPVATPKLVNWLGFFWFFLVFFGFFWGEHPPNIKYKCLVPELSPVLIRARILEVFRLK